MKDKNSTVSSKGFSFERSDLVYLLILVGVSIAIGVWLIATTVLITKDGPFYIELAKQIDSEPFEAFIRPNPGYNFLIWGHFKLLNLFGVKSWILSGQIASLVCRTLCVVPLYFLGRIFAGRVYSFLGMLILLSLPYPAEMGADILREWPYLLFLSTSFLFLAFGNGNGKWHSFFIAGLVSGIGFMVRPEAAIIVILGFIWAAAVFSRKHESISQGKAVIFAFYILAGFFVTAGPYLCFSSNKLPRKFELIMPGADDNAMNLTTPSVYKAGAGSRVAKAVGKLLSRLAENLNYFFTVPFALGVVYGAKKLRGKLCGNELFIFLLLSLYALMMILLHVHWGYISRRHCLPMVVLCFYYLPVGLEIMAGFLSGGKEKGFFGLKKDSRTCWFWVLIVLGFAANTGKAVKMFPMREDKKMYLEAARCVRGNSHPHEIIASEDLRIPLYADRKGIKYKGISVPEKANFIVILSDSGIKPEIEAKLLRQIEVDKDRGEYIQVYKRLK